MSSHKTVCFSLRDPHIKTIKRLGAEAGMNDSAILREIVELVSDCHVVQEGCFVRFEKPKFRWSEKGRYL